MSNLYKWEQENGTFPYSYGVLDFLCGDTFNHKSVSHQEIY